MNESIGLSISGAAWYHGRLLYVVLYAPQYLLYVGIENSVNDPVLTVEARSRKNILGPYTLRVAFV